MSADADYRAYADEVHRVRAEGPDAFHGWFDGGSTEEQAVRNGYWDFGTFITTHCVRDHLGWTRRERCLEIGYGGGRLLNAACDFFSQAIGIDVHDEADAVRAFLRARGKTNFELLKGTGDSLPVETASIDFVYSYIVLQHLQTFATLERYVSETSRCLRPGGVAQLYFGRFSNVPPSALLKHGWRGWIELRGAPVNATSLVVRVPTMRRLAQHCGLRVLEARRDQGGQGHLTLSQPDGH
jgi:SAM-dependent methyltransferase